MDDLLSEFLTETNESISTLDTELVNLEQNPNNPELIANIFRLVHTIKGTCGFLGLPRLETLAHAGENVLGKFRDGDLPVTEDAVTLIFHSMDRIKEILGVLEETEAEPEGDDSDLIARLDTMAAGHVQAAEPAPEPPAPEPVAEPVEEPEPVAAEAAVDPDIDSSLGRALKPGEVSLEELEAAFLAAPGPEDMAPPAPEPEPQPEPAAAPAADPAPAPKPAAATGETAAKDTARKAPEHSVANQSIRVHVDLLENLMNMVSELVLTRNQLLQMVRGLEDSEFTVPLQRLSHVTTELQEGVMKTRMQPIGNAWAKLPRIVRDLAHELDKKIDLQMLGADTELDRQVLELIKDPLTHMVRNSADHGLEPTADRIAAGKSETGKIVLNAFHEGGQINIEITDDGRGLPVEKIKQKALDNGVTTEAELETMSDQQILRFIFKAGFSTAQTVTAVSGRGVGMDVVRTNIEKIGGTVELKSQEGRGTSFVIKIPLTLAIVSALIVECGSERFAIPQLSVLELVGVSAESEHTIETINNTPVLRLRNRLLPLVYLRDILQYGDTSFETDEEAVPQDSFIVVTQVGNYTFGIVVDRVFDTEEIVVKPVAPLLRDVTVYSGTTILGDGSVIMIIDPNGIAEASGEVRLDQDADEDGGKARAGSHYDELTALLLFRAGNDEPKAVPLSIVARLEEVDVNDIEMSDGRMVVQYRGRLMPLVKIDDQAEMQSDGRQPILVFTDQDRSMGLVVDEIVDIVEDRLNVELAAARDGLLGTSVVAG